MFHMLADCAESKGVSGHRAHVNALSRKHVPNTLGKIRSFLIIPSHRAIRGIRIAQ